MEQGPQWLHVGNDQVESQVELSTIHKEGIADIPLGHIVLLRGNLCTASDELNT